jgi:predicted type IV restriction endonuclease
MEIADKVQEMAARVRTHKAGIATEEATKNAFVMPFISSVLGYDVFNPADVIPEFIADIFGRRGEKIDYALVCNGEIQILIEVKKVSEALKLKNAYQLGRYFHVTKARVAILTNGEKYEFYTDLDEPNKMDSKPFLVLDLTAIDETLLPEIAKVTKEAFDLDSVMSAAGELKYVGQMKRMLASEFKDPSSEFLRLFATEIYPAGKAFTQKTREELTPLVIKATAQFLNEQARERLKTALGDDAAPGKNDVVGSVTPPPVDVAIEEGEVQGDIVTTDEELEGHRIVQAIVCSEVSARRVIGRDSKTYFAILLDNNNRKPIARLWFNRKQRYIGVFDANKVETRSPIGSSEEIYRHAEQLRATVRGYLTTDPSGSFANKTPVYDAPA